MKESPEITPSTRTWSSSMETPVFIVVKFFGNKSGVDSQMLDTVWFTKDAAHRRAERMRRRHKWQWLVLETTLDLHTPAEDLKEQFRAQGFSV